MTSTDTETLTLLRESLAEAQMTVRSYDTKAQIVGVGYIFALGVVFQFNKVLPEVEQIGAFGLAAAWAIIILPILLFGFVLHPTRRTAPSLDKEPSRQLQYVLYVNPDRISDVDQLIDRAKGAEPAREIAFELLKVSNLRELKRKRFLRALFAAGACFLVLFVSQFLRAFAVA